MAGASRDVLLAAVVGAQGLRGEVRVKTFTASAEALARYGALHTRDGKRLTVTAVRAVKNGEAVLTIAELRDRASAEILRGAELFVSRGALPDLDREEYYHADLIGLRAEDVEGRTLGTIQAVHNYGAGDVIEIARPDGDTILLPFTRETVPRVEIAEGRVIVAVPEDVEAGEHGNVE